MRKFGVTKFLLHHKNKHFYIPCLMHVRNFLLPLPLSLLRTFDLGVTGVMVDM